MQIMEMIGVDDDRAAEHRKKVLGETCLTEAPSEYHILGLVLDLNIPLPEWNNYDVHDQAKILARQYVKGMVEIIDNHYREHDANAKRKH